MAKHTIQGPGGNVTGLIEKAGGASLIAKVSAWSANVETKTEDTTGFEDNGYGASAPIINKMSGSVGGTVDDSESPIPAALCASTVDFDQIKGQLVLQAYSGCTFTFNAVITNISLSRPNAGKADVTFNFVSSGPVTAVWNTAS